MVRGTATSLPKVHTRRSLRRSKTTHKDPERGIHVPLAIVRQRPDRVIISEKLHQLSRKGCHLFGFPE